MTTETERLLKEAKQLPPNERELLALSLLESIDNEADIELDEAWGPEVQRRLAAFDKGDVTPIPAGELLARMEAAVRGKRRLPPNAS